MAAKFLNSIRVLCEEGCENKFFSATEEWVNPDGMWDAYSVKIGDRSFSFVGIWASEEKLASIRPQMIEHLNSVRDFFEDLSPELTGTAPVSGLVVVTHKG